MSCQTDRGPLRCPTLDEVTAQVLALLPRGRAWQSHEGGPLSPAEVDFQIDTVQIGMCANRGARAGSVLWRFWRAFADVVTFATSRICDMYREFFCATQSETRDLWMAEYGLPDPCDPFPDLCVKVAALGGARCEYFAAILSRLGWLVTCDDGADICGARVGCTRAGKARPGRKRANLMRLKVHLSDSPGFVGRIRVPPRVGRMRAGKAFVCPADLAPMRCIVDRIAPAHVQIQYVMQ